MHTFWSVLLYTLLALTSVFMILIVLVQRGKGGGLAGAFGGAGGSSAFGTKAGDLFMKITVYVSLFWMGTSMVLTKLSSQESIGLPTTVRSDSGPSEPRLNAPSTQGRGSAGKAATGAARPAKAEADLPDSSAKQPRSTR